MQDPTGAPFEPSDKGQVLLLGDSFTNVFSLEPMGWGTSAGLGAQLARALDRDVDVHRAERRRRPRHQADAPRHARGRRGSPGRQDGGDLGARFAGARRRRLQEGRLVRAPGPGGGALRGLVLVTGAAGEVGPRLVRRLASDGWRVRGLVLPGDPLRARLDGTGCEIRRGRHPPARDARPRRSPARTPFSTSRPSFSPATRRTTTPSTGAAPRTWSPRPRAAGVRHFVYVSSASVVYPRLHALRASQAGRGDARRRRAAVRAHHRSADAGV